MKLYIEIKKMTFEDGIEHNIVNRVSDKEFDCYDEIINLSDDDKFIKDTFKAIYKRDKNNKDTEEIEDMHFVTKEQSSWWSFPLYEIVDGEIVDFDYTKYEYFQNTKRRNALTDKINSVYNPNTELKTLRKTLKKILDHLGIEDESFKKYNNKIEQIIIHNPKEE